MLLLSTGGITEVILSFLLSFLLSPRVRRCLREQEIGITEHPLRTLLIQIREGLAPPSAHLLANEGKCFIYEQPITTTASHQALPLGLILTLWSRNYVRAHQSCTRACANKCCSFLLRVL